MREVSLTLGEEKNRKKGRLSRLRNSYAAFNSKIKKRIVYRLFWGRSSSYKKYLHLGILILTAIVIITGFTSSFSRSKSSRILAAGSSNPGDIDLLEQGSDIQTVLQADTTSNFKILEYTVQEGENLESLASKFNITQESIITSNLDKINYYDPSVKVGDVLKIPPINGVLILADAGENADTVMNRLDAGNKIDIIEINNLDGPDYAIKEGAFVLVPDGKLKPPPKPAPVYPNVIYAEAPPIVSLPAASQAALNGISFINPLYRCAGYGFSRGFSSWHNAVDLYGPAGCDTSAVAAGTVIFSGWEPYGGGYGVTVDHGGGVHTIYYHHDALYVRTGEYVQAGQAIGAMGCTGLCTGRHLHIGLRVNYIYIDPAGYIPF